MLLMFQIAGGIILAILFFMFLPQILQLSFWLLGIGILLALLTLAYYHVDEILALITVGVFLVGGSLVFKYIGTKIDEKFPSKENEAPKDPFDYLPLVLAKIGIPLKIQSYLWCLIWILLSLIGAYLCINYEYPTDAASIGAIIISIGLFGVVVHVLPLTIRSLYHLTKRTLRP